MTSGTSTFLDAKQILACITDRRLRLILLPTEACNFRCVYCFEDFRLARMKPEVVTGVRRLLDRRVPGLKRLRISWYGGEPLLALDILETILTDVRELRRRHRRLRFASDITTNAYHLDAGVFRKLLAFGVDQYQITFDGPKEWHDRRRLRADGAGTFDAIWENLVAMATVPEPFQVTVRLHVDAENHHAIPLFLDQYKQAFGGDSRFELFIRRISRLGGANDDKLPVLNRRQGQEVLASLRACAKERQLEPWFEGDRNMICSAAKSNSFVVRADGRLNKCTIALDHPENQVGRLTEKGRLVLDGDKLGGWQRGLLSQNLDELKCPMNGLADTRR